MTGVGLPMSAPKERLFERLALSEQNPNHKAIYNKMREEASAGRDRLSLSRDNLVEQCRINTAIQPPYSWDNLSETARHREILSIYRSASPITKAYYDYGSYRSGPNEENWVVQWCLWHVFRYRDNRNRARGNGAGAGSYHDRYAPGGPASAVETKVQRGKDEEDAMSTVSSDIDSTFTGSDGSQSSRTSFGSGLSVAIEHLALDEFVALLLSQATIRDLCAEALLLQRLPVKRLWRNLRRLLKSFAEDLMQEGIKDDEKAAATLFRSRTSYILNELRKQLDQSSKSGNKSEEESEEESEDESEEEKHIILPALDSVRAFILKSKAFLKFQQKLRNFIYPTFASELENLVQMFSPQGSAQKRTNAGLTEAMECCHRLDGLVLDLISVDLDSILIRYGNLCTRWDRIKLFVEWTTRHRWDWWPFSDPAGPLRHGSAYVSWRCNCGERRYEVVPVTFAQKIEKLLHKYENATETDVPHGKTPGSVHRQPPSGQTSDLRTQLSPQSTNSSTRDNLSNLTPKHSPQQVFNGNRRSGQTINMLSVNDQVVFLGVNNGGNYTIAQISVTKMDDDTFYETLREKYNKLRGVFRRYLSYMIYSHCEFAQIEKIGEDEFAPSQSRPSFPDDIDDDYNFKPKPPKPIPPIQPHEFNLRFYFCRRGGKQHKHHFNFIPCRQKCGRYPGPNGALDRIPKRNRWLNIAGQEREFFWGLLAIERISLSRVFLYHILILSGPFVFWWLWIFFWGHSGDLQNASVPFSVICVLLSMIWFPLLHK